MKETKRTNGKWYLLAVIAVCVAPVIASYFTYYVIKPQSRTNYGTLLEPSAYPIPSTLGTARVYREL